MKKRLAIFATICGIFILLYLIYKENAPEKISRFPSEIISSPTTIVSTNNYYDSDFNISINYPRKWLQVAEREFRGDDGYLKISELPDYHSFSADHVCSDYAYRNMGEKDITFIHFGSYEVRISTNKLSIKEVALKKAIFDGESWDLEKFSLSNRSPNDSPISHYGETITVNNHELAIKQSHVENTGQDLIEVLQDNKVIFSINIITGQSAFVSTFCAWNGSWFLETSDFIIQDGEILNHKFGYDEMFGWRILDKKPFYFFTKDGSVFLSYDGQELPIKYDYVPHYRCCEVGSQQNPNGSANKIWFLGARSGFWYSVEITANE